MIFANFVAWVIRAGADEPSNGLKYLCFKNARTYVLRKFITPTKFFYVYYYIDHLGNVRMSYTDDGSAIPKILEESHYYPFGLKHENYASERFERVKETNGELFVIQPTERREWQYKYQGQERQDELNLNWDSFKWRNYDFAIGRFMNIDPLAEKYSYQSPYNFAENKVIWSRELEGLESWYTTSESTNPHDNPMRKPQSGPLTDNYAKDAGYASYGVTKKQFVDNGVGDKLVENISNMTDSELNPHGDCFAVAKDRINQAFEEVTGEGLPNTEEFNKQWNVVGRDAKAAEGSASALSDAGLGDFKNRSQIINGELKPGAAVQIFIEKTIEASAFGHSFIFLNYTKTKGNITGMKVADQGWLNGRNVSLEYPTMSGANLGVTVETLVKNQLSNLMKTVILIFLSLSVFFNCVEKPFSKNLEATHQKGISNSIKMDLRESSSVSPLDSIVETVFGKNLVQESVTHKRDIQKYLGLLEIFNTKGIISLKFKYSKNDAQKFSQKGLPGRINQLMFDNNNSARKAFVQFKEEIMSHKLSTKINIKAGGICFIDGNSIWLIPIKSCGDNKNIDLIASVIKQKILKDSSDCIKMYCSLEKFEILNRDKN